MKSHWELLGIEPTSDQRAVKRAYARMIKRHPPDEQPDRFAEIREAYEAALEDARYGAPADGEEDWLDRADIRVVTDEEFARILAGGDIDVPNSDRPERAATDGPQERADAPQFDESAFVAASDPKNAFGAGKGDADKNRSADLDVYAAADAVIDRIETGFGDPFKRNQASWWRDVLSDSAMEDIRVRREVEEALFNILADRLHEAERKSDSSPITSSAAWSEIDRVFDWGAQDARLAREFGYDDFDRIIRIMNNPASVLHPPAISPSDLAEVEDPEFESLHRTMQRPPTGVEVLITFLVLLGLGTVLAIVSIIFGP